MRDIFAEHVRILESTQCYRVTGRVLEVTGLTVIAEGFPQPVGSMASIERPGKSPPVVRARPARMVGSVAERIPETNEEPRCRKAP